MTLGQGRHYLAIPGPSVMPDRVLAAMHRPAPNIYEGGLTDAMPGIVADLKAVARTRHDVAIYIGNGHAGWEAALANTHAPGDLALVLATGAFAHGWAGMAQAMQIETRIIDHGKHAPVDPDRLAQALAADTDQRIKSVMVVQADTSTSVLSDIAQLRAVLDAAGHPALLMVDCIAALACDRFEMDAWGADLMVAGSQKGLMTPPGLAFVYFNDRARAAAPAHVSNYWNWQPRADGELLTHYFCGTAPTHHLFGLREALDMIAEEGIEAIWTRHATLARAIWAAADAWATAGALRLNVADPAQRSHAVTTLHLPSPKATELRRWVAANAGVTLGIGLGFDTDDDPGATGTFRIGHMGHVNAQMILGALGAIETGMKALDIPHGPGAISAAAELLSTG